MKVSAHVFSALSSLSLAGRFVQTAKPLGLGPRVTMAVHFLKKRLSLTVPKTK